MLRQALEGNHNTHDVVDTVETSNETSSLLVPSQQQQQQQQQHQREPGQTSIATPYTDDDDDYGGVEHHNNNFNDNDEEEDGESSDGSYEDDEEEDDDDWSYQSQQPNIARRAWNAIRGLFLLVANVENLWDSPVSTFYGTDVHEHHHNMYGNASSTCSYQQQQHPQLQSQLHHYQSGAAAAAAAEEGAVSSIPRGIHRRRSYFIVLFWFFILAGAYATERCTFKFLVDRAGPFRLFSVEMVTGSHATMLGCWVLGKHMYYRRYQQRSGNTGVIGSINCSSQLPLGISLVDVGYMAILDTFHLLLVFLTGRFVCPTLSVILVQFTLPLTALLTQFVHPDGNCYTTCCRPDSDEEEDNDNTDEERNILARANNNNEVGSYQIRDSAMSVSDRYSNGPSEGIPLPGWGGLSAEHLWGSLILTLAVVLALLPSLYSIIDPSFFYYADSVPTRTAYNTMLYVSSCFIAAASQLFKENIFLKTRQPVNAGYLNFLLSLFQFILATVMAPLIFSLQGLGAGKDWASLYPSSHFSSNVISGIKCFLGLLSEESAQNDFPEPATCYLSLGLVLTHSFSIISVGCAVDKIVNAGATKAMYRGISAGIIIAVLLMYEYEMRNPRFNYGPVIDGLNLISLILLVIGAEVYHRVTLSGSTFETEYPKVEGIYDDEE